MVKKMKMLFLSCLTIMLCVSAIAVGTYALFSQEVKITNHLQAGTLSAELWRVDLYGYAGSDEISSDEEVNFTNTDMQTNNIFGLTNGKVIVPTNEITATMVIKNTGNLAFKYWIEYKISAVEDKDNNDQQQAANDALVNELVFKVTDDTGNDLGCTTESGALSLMANTASDEFCITITFNNPENIDDDNLAQNGMVSVDIVVHAVQMTQSELEELKNSSNS